MERKKIHQRIRDYPPVTELRRRVDLRSSPAEPVAGQLSLGVIGAGQFARGVLLPAFAAQRVAVEGVCTASGMTAKSVAERYKASFATSDPAELLSSDKVDALLVATRHDQHARLALAGTSAGKAVFVEKPLAIVEEDLAELARHAELSGAPRLMVGFNRRFSPLAARCRELFAGCEDPLYVFYRVNAGALPADSWVYDPVEGGGRILGEICHFVDTIVYLTGSRPARVFAEPVHVPGSPDPHRDSVSVSLRMENGSVGVIHYLTHGDPSLAKEYFEVFGGGRAAVLDNYRSLTTHQGNKRRRQRLRNQAKGHEEEIEAFVRALREGGPMPIDFEDLLAVSQTCFLILRSLEKGQPVPYRAPGVEAQ